MSNVLEPLAPVTADEVTEMFCRIRGTREAVLIARMAAELSGYRGEQLILEEPEYVTDDEATLLSRRTRVERKRKTPSPEFLQQIQEIRELLCKK